MNNYIPKYLKERAQWVNWRYEERPNGKLSKVPFMPNGQPAKTNNANTLSPYETVQNAQGFNGIGFVLREGDNLVCIDLDHVIQPDGTIEPWAKDILDLFKTTYIEKSPSGEGLHIWCFGKAIRCGKGTTEKRIEIYDYTSPRYLTVTGDIYQHCPTDITQAQAQLDELHEKYFKPKNDNIPALTPPTSATEQGKSARDLNIDIFTLTKNDVKFNALFNGDFSGYPSHSEADFALCLKLAFYTQNNAAEIDRLFRQSGLFRPDWDKKHGQTTYGQRTIQNALAKSVNKLELKENNTGVLGQSPTVPDNSPTVPNNSPTVPDEQAQQDKSVIKTRKTLPPQSILGNLLAKRINNLIFDAVVEEWMIYDDNHWQKIHALRAEDIIDKYIHEVVGNVGYSAGYVSGVTKFLKVKKAVFEFNKVPDTIPFKNGLLRITDKKLFKHDKKYYTTWIIPYDYTPQATCKPIIDWLSFCVGGNEDQLQLLRAYMNAIVTSRVELQRYLEIIGVGGSGKGTFIRLCELLVGEQNTHSTELKLLEKGQFETACLYGKKLITITDSQNFAGDVSVLKAITGQDTLRYERKGIQATAGFKATGLVVIAANEAISSKDYTSGIARRRITVYFNQLINSKERRDLTKEFQPYIVGLINWVLALSPEQVASYVRDTHDNVHSLHDVERENLINTN
ncbi:D5-like protein, partial [Beggiatoa alba B18LD]